MNIKLSIRHRAASTACGTIVLAILAVIGATPAQAAGLLVADGGFGGVLELREHTVRVTVNNGIAVTEVDQVFFNTERRQVGVGVGSGVISPEISLQLGAGGASSTMVP